MEQVEGYRQFRINEELRQHFSDYGSGLKKNPGKVHFVRILGWNSDLCSAVCEMDARLTAETGHGTLFYNRLRGLPRLLSAEDTSYYSGCYDRFAASGYAGFKTKTGCMYNRNLKPAGQSVPMKPEEAFCKILTLYCSTKKAVTDSMKKNFAVKMLYWFDFVFEDMRQQEGDGCVKIAAENVTKDQEYLFYYFLALTGCDVLLLQSRQDIEGADYQKLSKAVRAAEFSQEEIPVFNKMDRNSISAASVRMLNADIAKRTQDIPEKNQDKIIVKIPQRTRHRQQPAQQSPVQAADHFNERREKTFEELAALSSSVVMIAVHDKEGEVISTGSGIMAASAGYILTNDHVARGGYSYSVRIENDSTAYRTDELIKYNPVLDLALLRIDRQLNPLLIYNGNRQLVRGQCVAAIGSPLGLFNSVSNGIISGFRKIDGVDMIQFTAPISNGSSGGALLNMYGEVIGISTAGFDRGQNINLAVGYENIRLFMQGFLSFNEGGTCV